MRLAVYLLMVPIEVLGASVSGYIGTHTSDAGLTNGSVGIYSFHWNSETGLVSGVRAAGTASNPSFLLVHPNGRYLYAVNEEGPDADRVTTFSIGESRLSGRLRNLGSVSSMGRGPCHLSLDLSGRWLFVANYGSGSIAVYPVRSDGTLGKAQQTIQQQEPVDSERRQGVPHAHEVVPSPDGHFVLSVDLGLDRIFVYRFDAISGILVPHDPFGVQFPRGSGPRHLVFSKDATKVYVLTELTAQLITLRWDAERGTLVQVAQMSASPLDYQGPLSGAELALSANGRILYASNRGQSNSISTFRVGLDGVPTAIGSIASGGKTPRFIVIDPSGRFLLAANQGSNNLVAFRIDPMSGKLIRTGTADAAPAPTDIVFRR